MHEVGAGVDPTVTARMDLMRLQEHRRRLP
jgi:hypothetical protein